MSDSGSGAASPLAELAEIDPRFAQLTLGFVREPAAIVDTPDLVDYFTGEMDSPEARRIERRLTESVELRRRSISVRRTLRELQHQPIDVVQQAATVQGERGEVAGTWLRTIAALGIDPQETVALDFAPVVEVTSGDASALKRSSVDLLQSLRTFTLATGFENGRSNANRLTAAFNAIADQVRLAMLMSAPASARRISHRSEIQVIGAPNVIGRCELCDIGADGTLECRVRFSLVDGKASGIAQTTISTVDGSSATLRLSSSIGTIALAWSEIVEAVATWTVEGLGERLGIVDGEIDAGHFVVEIKNANEPAAPVAGAGSVSKASLLAEVVTDDGAPTNAPPIELIVTVGPYASISDTDTDTNIDTETQTGVEITAELPEMVHYAYPDYVVEILAETPSGARQLLGAFEVGEAIGTFKRIRLLGEGVPQGLSLHNLRVQLRPNSL